MRKRRRRPLEPAILLAWLLACPALAGADRGEVEASQADADSALSEYGSAVSNRFLMGVNSVLTFPADPIMSTVEPLEEFAELPGGAVSQYFFGLGQGVLLGAYRVSMGVLDIAFAPVTPFVMLSPEPRYMLFEGVEHDVY